MTGAGQISMAIARGMGLGKKIILGDKKIENANAIVKIMNEAGFDVVPVEMDFNGPCSPIYKKQARLFRRGKALSCII